MTQILHTQAAVKWTVFVWLVFVCEQDDCIIFVIDACNIFCMCFCTLSFH